MAIYKDVQPLEVVMYKSGGKEFDAGVDYILNRLDALPLADVVEIEVLKKWLYEMAIHNVGTPVVDFSYACEDIISRLEGLRNFARDRSHEDD
jgi:hypothetical protein